MGSLIISYPVKGGEFYSQSQWHLLDLGMKMPLVIEFADTYFSLNLVWWNSLSILW